MITNYKIIEETPTRFKYRYWSKKYACMVGFIASVSLVANLTVTQSLIIVARLLVTIQLPITAVLLIFVLPLTIVEIDTEKECLTRTSIIRWFFYKTVVTIPIGRIKGIYNTFSYKTRDPPSGSIFIEVTDVKKGIKVYTDISSADASLIKDYLQFYLFPNLSSYQTFDELDKRRKSLEHLFGDDPNHEMAEILSCVLFGFGLILIVLLGLMTISDPSIYYIPDVGTFFLVFFCSLIGMTAISGLVFFHIQRIKKKQKTSIPGKEAAIREKTRPKKAYPHPAKPAAQTKEEIPMPRASDEIVKITEDNILKYMPDGKWVKISYIIKVLNIKEISDARFLEVKLKTLLNQGKLERETQDGKSYYKKNDGVVSTC